MCAVNRTYSFFSVGSLPSRIPIELGADACWRTRSRTSSCSATSVSGRAARGLSAHVRSESRLTPPWANSAPAVAVRTANTAGPAGPAVFAVRTATAGALFAQGGVSLDSLRTWADKPLAARPLTDVALQLDVRERVLQHASAPNSIGILEGSDPTLKKEYVLFTAHMDHIGTPSAGEGCTPRGARRSDVIHVRR